MFTIVTKWLKHTEKKQAKINQSKTKVNPKIICLEVRGEG